MKKIIISLVILSVIGLVGYFIKNWFDTQLERDPNFAHGNGRIEATEINIAARLSGKVEKVTVLEGEKVRKGQVLVAMQTNVLVAQLAQAEAQKAQAIAADGSAQAKINYQKATLEKMKADLERVTAIEKNAKVRYDRYKELSEKDAASRQLFETTETEWLTAKANRISAIAAISEAEANLKMAYADAQGAKANILAAEAEIDRIKADIDDSILKAPLTGRIQYRIAEPGEVLSAGGRALNMVDLTDVYITFFLPEEIAGKVKIGADVRIVLDAAPKYPFPAKVTYVASIAQFTPKTVETSTERQKLMFRVKAHIDRAFLEEFMDLIKTGLPGVAWVKLNPTVEWPKQLEASEAIKAKVEQIRKELKARGLAPNDVVKSQTGEQAKATVIDVSKADEKIKGATQEQRTAVTVDMVKQVNSIVKKESAEKSAKAAVQENKGEKARVEEQTKAVKKHDAEAKKATVKDSAK